MTPESFKEKRLLLGYSQREMAERLNMGKNGYRTVQRIESGDTHISGAVERLLEYIETFGDLPNYKNG